MSPAWCQEFMFTPSCPPTVCSAKLRGLRHHLDNPCVEHMMIAARNPRNWSEDTFKFVTFP
eukprot:6168917-Amphidinium_carterae.2